jgi:RND family efflux transporter MFP subunit
MHTAHAFFIRTMRQFQALKIQYRIAAVVVVLAALGAGIFFSTRSTPATTASDTPTVTLASLGSLSGGSVGSQVIGTIRSVSQADLLSESAGTVTRPNTTLGATVPAGFGIATLENAAQSAQVLQAQGAYDAAVASRNITSLQSGNSTATFAEAQNTVRTTYRSSYATISNTLATDVDAYFGRPQNGPQLYSNGANASTLDTQIQSIKDALQAWQTDLANVDSEDPGTLLDTATATTNKVSAFLTQITIAANARNTNATPTQLSNLVAARTSIDGVLASLSTVRNDYNAKKTASEVGTAQISSSGTATASADATVKQALGALRAAQANYEKTVIRAPIGGTVNFLPIHVGDYVTSLMHVATVAQNGALEIVLRVTESDRQSLSVGTHLKVEGTLDGIVTSIAPAIDPLTGQVEVHVAISKSSNLVNGQTVHVALPNISAPVNTPSTAAAASSTPLLIPLTALKLTPSARVVFSVGADNRLVANPVDIGDVQGDKIGIHTNLPSDLRIVVDARGLSEGEKVTVASTP